MHTNLWFWIAFNSGVLCVLAIDLFGFQRKAHAPSTKEAAIWTAVWVALSLGFNALIWYWEGHAKALEFLTTAEPTTLTDHHSPPVTNLR
jgi:tellurite resistance protein TerC